MDEITQHHLTYFESKAIGHQKYRKRFSYYWDDISKFCDFFIHSDSSVLEIGCGTGELLDTVGGKDKVGVDFSPSMISIAKESFPDIEFHVGDAQQLRLNRKFDVIILSNLIGYLDCIQDVLDELKQLCHPHTRIHITYYNQQWEPALTLMEMIRLKRKTPVQNWISRHDLRNMLYIAGFDVLFTCKRMLVPIKLPILSNFMNNYIAPLPLINRVCLNTFTFARLVSQESRNYSVTVIIPARNESANVDRVIENIPNFGSSQEIIFVEGGSTDDTWEKLGTIKESYQGERDIKIARQAGKGKADAVRKGFSLAGGDVVIILDADLTVHPKDLPKFYEAIATGKGEFINGCRLVYPMESNAMRPLNKMGNRLFSKFYSWMLKRPVKDTLCGTKAMFRADYLRMPDWDNMDPFGDFTWLYGAYKLNLKIVDLPVRYKERKFGETQISRIKHGWQLIRMTWKMIRHTH